jgi:hypothetical protein
MYSIVRGRRQGKLVAYEEDIDAERFPDVDLDNGPAIINHLVQILHSQMGETDYWEACDLTDSFFNREDTYIHFNGRGMCRSDTPWRTKIETTRRKGS